MKKFVMVIMAVLIFCAAVPSIAAEKTELIVFAAYGACLRAGAGGVLSDKYVDRGHAGAHRDNLHNGVAPDAFRTEAVMTMKKCV